MELIHLIGAGERTIGEMVTATGSRQAKVSQHLAILRQRGGVTTRRDGTTIHYGLAYPALLEACAIRRSILMRQLEAVSELVEQAT